MCCRAPRGQRAAELQCAAELLCPVGQALLLEVDFAVGVAVQRVATDVLLAALADVVLSELHVQAERRGGH
jgi:hypothetical protein